MKNLLGYEAPSTHTENWEDPLLDIGEDDDIPLKKVEAFLPEHLTLFVKPKALWCPSSVQLTYKNFTPYALYQQHKKVSSIDLHYDYKGYYVLDGQGFPLNQEAPFTIDLPENGLLYKKPFLFLDHPMECPDPDKKDIKDLGEKTASPLLEDKDIIYPLGGTYDPDPSLCIQDFFREDHKDDPIVVHVYPTQKALYPWIKRGGCLEDFQSLADHIVLKKIPLFLLYEGRRWEYRSYRYRLYNTRPFSIDFFKHF